MKLTRLVCRVLGLILLIFGAVNPVEAGTPGKCAEPAPTCDKRNICGSSTSACKMWVSENIGIANATPQNLPNGNVWKPGDPICVKAGTRISWSTQENESEFKATFGVPHPFTRTPAAPAIFHGKVGHPDKDTAKVGGCYQYKLEHWIEGQPEAVDDPKVIVTDIVDDAKHPKVEHVDEK
jgi:hypothetical protein